MEELIVKENINIKDRIYIIRGKQVMFDFDLAELYECTNGTKDINRAVKRNPNKFDSDAYFQLTAEETKSFWFQFGTKKLDVETRGGKFNAPHAFTELGVSMLSTVLHTPKAIETSKAIMRAFIMMKEYISTTLLEQTYYNTLTLKNTEDIKLLKETFDSFENEKEINGMYFNGKIYDAYSKVIDIFKTAKDELIIVDRYTDKTMLDMIKDLKCSVIIITGTNSRISKLDLDKYNSTYNNLTLIYDDTWHDRYFVVDKEKIYHSGNSINHIGYRKSSVDLLNDDNVKRTILKDIESII